MSRASSAKHRCTACRLHKTLCLCGELPELVLQTRLRLVTHRTEINKTTNTGRFVALSVRDSEVLVHGHRYMNLAPPYLQGRQGLVLYPGEEAEILQPNFGDGRPVTLFIPDGSWRQATRMMRRLPWLGRLRRVTLPSGGAPSSYWLRSTERQGGLATAEATARALGILEGPEVEKQLIDVFRMMVDRSLFSRGKLLAGEVFGGIPEGVFQDDPSGLRRDRPRTPRPHSCG